MEIQCPSCQKKLSIGDQFGGQLVKCPACAGVFMAPALPAKAVPVSPAMVAPPTPPVFSAPPVALPPASSQSTASYSSAAPFAPVVAPPVSAQANIIPFSNDPPPPAYAPTPAPPAPPAAPPPALFIAEEEPEVPGVYTKTKSYQLRPDILRWVAPVSLTLIFLLSFFHWIGVGVASFNLWEIAFGAASDGVYVMYVLFVIFFALPLAWAKLVLEMNLIPLPVFLRPFWKWRTLPVLTLLVLAILFPLYHVVRFNFAPINPMSLGMKIALRVHLIAIVALVLEYWLSQRKKSHLPLPELTVRW